VVVIKGEYADSPPWLDLHPERMREKEKARVSRLKVQKKEREAKRKQREEEKWRVPAQCWSIRLGSRSTGTNDVPKLKSALRSSSTSRSTSESTLSTTSPQKHVSWAPSTSTLDKHGRQGKEPLADDDERSHTISKWPLQGLRAAHSMHPRTSAWIEERSARGPVLIGAMSPEVALRWGESRHVRVTPYLEV